MLVSIALTTHCQHWRLDYPFELPSTEANSRSMMWPVEGRRGEGRGGEGRRGEERRGEERSFKATMQSFRQSSQGHAHSPLWRQWWQDQSRGQHSAGRTLPSPWQQRWRPWPIDGQP